MEKILDVKELSTNFYTDEGVVKAVDGLSYHINIGECVGLVGESGCGKSVSAMSIPRCRRDKKKKLKNDQQKKVSTRAPPNLSS